MFLLLSLSLVFSETLNLSIKEAVDLALKNNENNKISRLNYDKAIAQYKETRSAAFPKLTASIDWYNYVLSPVLRMDMPAELGGNTIEAKIKKPYEMSMGATLSQAIWTFGKVSTAIELADNYKTMQLYTKNVSSVDIELQTKILYYTVLYTRFLKQIANESYNNALKNKQTLISKFSNGRISRFDNIKMSADVSARVPAMSISEKSYKNSLIQLSTFIGSDSTEIELKDTFINNFPKYEIRKLKETLELNEPTLKTLKTNIKVNRNLADYRKAGFYPDLGAFANYSYTGNSDQVFIGNEYLRNTFTVGLSLKGNLWDSGETKNKYKQAEYDFEISDLKYEQARKNLFLELETTFSDYTSLIDIYNAHLKYQDLSKQTYLVSQSSFISGKLTQMDLNNVELMYTGSKLNSLETLYNINTVISKIERLTGTGDVL